MNEWRFDKAPSTGNPRSRSLWKLACIIALVGVALALYLLPTLQAGAANASAATPLVKNMSLSGQNCLRTRNGSDELELGDCSPVDDSLSWAGRESGEGILLVSLQKASDGAERCLVNVGWQPRMGACDASRAESLWLLRDGQSGHVRLQNAYSSEERCLDFQEGEVVLHSCTSQPQPSALWSTDALPRTPAYRQTHPERYPQPRQLQVASLPSAVSERDRLKQNMLWVDWQPTGFYIAPFTELTITVEGNPGNAVLEALIGTPSLVHPWATAQGEPMPSRQVLKPGTNSVFATRGGLVSIRYVTDSIEHTAPALRITLGEQAQPIPYFVKGLMDQNTWLQLLASSTIPYAALSSERVILTGSLTTLNSTKPDAQALLDTYDLGISNGQDYTAGLDGKTRLNTPSPLRPLVVESRSGTNPAATDYRIMMPYPNLTPFDSTRAQSNWGTWHELGHQRQSPVLTWDRGSLGEVAVNIYTLAALRRNHWTSPEAPGPGHWEKAVVYLAAPDEDREFENLSKIENAIQLSMFEQLRTVDGGEETFYPRLEQLIRAEQDPGSEASRKQRFQVLASKASGYDLGDYFSRWGLRPDQATLAAIAALKLPKPPSDHTKAPVFGGSNDPRILDLWGFWLPSGKLYVDGHASLQGMDIQVIDQPRNRPLIATSDQHLEFVNDHLDQSFLEDGRTTLKAQIKDRDDTLKTFTVVNYPAVTSLVAQRQPNGQIKLSGTATPKGANIEVRTADGSWPGVAHIGPDGTFENDHLVDHHMADGKTTFELRVEYLGRSFKERFTTQLVE